ncbi:MAG: methyltransferase [Gemmatimonadaceae bacterium]|nr:methyltransferase [Acetobacteraceae bacterium]
MQTTDGWLLNRRLHYAQPADGYRTGIEPVILAASVPAQAGSRVLEAGIGAGAGLLCLAARVRGITGVGIEIDPAMAALARRNIGANSLPSLSVVTVDLAAWHGDGRFDHAFANPPWHGPADTPSPTARRRLATHEGRLPVEGWIVAIRGAVADGGTLSVIVPGAQIGRVAAAFRTAGFGRLVMIPLWPQAGRDAKLLVIRASAGVLGPDRLTPGLELHGPNGGFTPAAEAILRDGAPLPG